MCGIAGYIGSGADESAVWKMTEALRHRGPNKRSVYRADDTCVLGHARLSIMDLSENATQPMTDTSSKTSIAVNGEIYNYPALKKELETAGYVFRTSSDSEVVLHGYIKWGEKIISMLDGMFSLAIYDGREKKLILARDPAGMKPLYYYTASGGFMFASEIKSFYEVAREDMSFEPQAMLAYLAYRYVPAPLTPYKNMHKLEPGHTLTLKDGKISLTKNWDYTLKEITDEEGTALRLSSFLDDNVRRHLSSDVPVGLLLSGGIDSSAVGSYMSRHMENINAFCCGFDEDCYDERPYARISASSCGIKPNETVMDWPTLKDSLNDYFTWFDEPFFDYSAIAVNKLCRMADKAGIRVLLSGEGADEIFAGYRWYDYFSGENKSDSRLLDTFFRYKYYFDNEMLDKLSGKKTGYDYLWLLRKYDRPDLGLVNRAQVLDFHTFLPDDMLVKNDIASMAEGIELRIPFLNKTMLDCYFLLNEKVLYKNGERKALLKKALKSVLPDNILTTRKKGFGFPMEKWENEIESLCRKTMKNGMMEQYGFVCPSGLEHALSTYNVNYKWLLLTAEMWMRKKLAGDDITGLIYE